MLLDQADLPALALGAAVLGSGGGGSTHVGQIMAQRSTSWPVTVHDVAELDPTTPCIAVGYVGSTLLLEERLPGHAPFDEAIAAAQRWLGSPARAVCTLEAAGLNGLTALHLAGSHQVVDADCMGRGLPDLDQLSLLIDDVPGLVVCAPTGSGGVALLDGARPADVERVVRTAIESNGGWAGLVIAGFTVADLVQHAIHGSTRRALSVGRVLTLGADLDASALASSVGGTLLGVGRVMDVRQEPDRPDVISTDVRTSAGDVLRLVSRSEHIAALLNGKVMANSPTLVVTLDAATRAPLQVHECTMARDLIILTLPAPQWWSQEPRRAAVARPAHWGLDGLSA
nr:DUF917 domain-containing protein [Ornithinimicrobium sp. HY1793]